MTDAATILAVLRDLGPLTPPAIRAVTGLGRIRTQLALWKLERRGLVRSWPSAPTLVQAGRLWNRGGIVVWRVYEAKEVRDGYR